MGILDNIHPALEILPLDNSPDAAISMPVDENNLAALLDVFPGALEEYIQIIKECDGLVLTSSDGRFYMWLFSALDTLYTMKDWCSWLLDDMPGCFFFGRDGDDLYFVGQNGEISGVYKVEASSPVWNYADFIGSSIKSIIVEGQGWADQLKPII